MEPLVMEIPKKIFEHAWDDMDETQQRSFFSKNGFLVAPEIFSAAEIAAMHKEIESLGLEDKDIDMSEAFCRASTFAPMIDNPKLTSALKSIFGPEFVCFKGAYVPKKSKAKGAPPQRTALHVDYGILEPEGDYRNSSALWVNVICYLSDMTLEHAPLSIVPGSHTRYDLQPASDMEMLKDEAVTLLTKAGDAVIFLHNTVHAGGVNVSGYTQHMVFCSYRASWARHIGHVREWPKAFVDSAPPSRRRLISDLNSGALERGAPVFVHRYFPPFLLKKVSELLSTVGGLLGSPKIKKLGDRLWAAHSARKASF